MAEKHAALAVHDPNDYPGLGRIQAEIDVLGAEATTLEERWLELTELLGE